MAQNTPNVEQQQRLLVFVYMHPWDNGTLLLTAGALKDTGALGAGGRVTWV